MRPPDRIMIDGRAYSWRRIVKLRRLQVEAWKASRPRQSALFELREDRRSSAERTAAGRFEESILLAWLSERPD